MSSGTYNLGPKVQPIVDDAFEDAGVDPQVIATPHLKSAFRALRRMLNSEWSTYGIMQWQILQAIHTVSVGEIFFNPPAGFLDITEAVLRRPGALTVNSDVEMFVITRQEYMSIANKNDQGRPDRYFVDRQAGVDTTTELSNAVVNYWQAGTNTTDMIVYNYFHQDQDVTDTLGDTLDIPQIAVDAITAGLAMRMALKYNPAKYEVLREEYKGTPSQDPTYVGGALGRLKIEYRERGDIQIYAAFEPRTGRR